MTVAKFIVSELSAPPIFAPALRKLALLTFGLALSGCVSAAIPTLREPTRLYSVQEEMDEIKFQVSPIESKRSFAVLEDERNNFITLRMYAIDAQYTLYESQLTHESQETSLGSSLINLGLTGAASVAPVGQAPRVLSAIASGVTGASAAYEKDILLSQAIQNLEAQMRTDRNTQAAIILANMRCSIRDYPMGLALSDLEEYYRAGTMTNALIGVSRTVSKAEAAAKATKNAASASPQIAEIGKAQLQASADALSSEADSATLSQRCSKSTTPKTVRADPITVAPARVDPPVITSPTQPSTGQVNEQMTTAQAICRNQECVGGKPVLNMLCDKLANASTKRLRQDAANSLASIGSVCLR